MRKKSLPIIFFILNSVTLVSFQTQAQQYCADIFSFKTIHNVPNARIQPTNYERTMSRDLPEITEVLSQMNNSDINNFLQEIGPSKKIIDSGGGLSLYGVEWADRGANVVVINGQNMYSLLTRFRDPNFVNEFLPAQHIGGNNYVVDRSNLSKGDVSMGRAKDPLNGYIVESIARICGIRISDYFKKNGFVFHGLTADPFVLRTETNSIFNSFLNKVQTLRSHGKFKYIIGLAQNALIRLRENEYDGIFDYNGSFFYSAEKIELIDGYLRVLKPGSQGIIVTDRGSKTKVNDKSLEEYLISHWPKIFSSAAVTITGNFGEQMQITALLFKKPDTGIIPNLSKFLRRISTSYIKTDIPIVNYEVISP